jgi:hypothetical protein
MGQEGNSARRSGSGVSNHSDMGLGAKLRSVGSADKLSTAIRRGDHDRLQKLDQHRYSGGGTSGPLEGAPAWHFLHLRIRLGMAVTLRGRVILSIQKQFIVREGVEGWC